MQQPTAEQMQKMMAAMQPGEHHKHLDYFVGKWKLTMKTWMCGPDDSATESTGEVETEWALGKRFLMSRSNGQMMGSDFESIRLLGYDAGANMYVGSQASSMCTQLLNFSGVRSQDGKTFTFYGPMHEPGLDVFGRMVKYETRIVDDNTYVEEVVDLHVGDHYKVFEITFQRATDGGA